MEQRAISGLLLVGFVALVVMFNQLIAISPASGSQPVVTSIEELVEHQRWRGVVYVLPGFWVQSNFSDFRILSDPDGSEFGSFEEIQLRTLTDKQDLGEVNFPSDGVSVFSSPIPFVCPDYHLSFVEPAELCELNVYLSAKNVGVMGSLKIVETYIESNHFAWIDCDLLMAGGPCPVELGPE